MRTRVWVGIGILSVGVVVGVGSIVRSLTPQGQGSLPQIRLEAPGGGIVVEVAKTEQTRAAGLSDRPPLARGHGMLFLFPQAGTYPFWMYRMRFPLDIVYLKEGVIQEVFANVPKPVGETPPQTVHPQGVADAVLEVSAGESAHFGWKPGTRLFYPEGVR